MVEVGEQASAAPGWCHRGVAVWCALEQLGADVGFEALELQVEVLGVQAECVCCAVDAGVGHHSTWNVHNTHLLHGPLRTILEPNATIEEFGLPTRFDDTLHVPLGPPVLRLTPEDVVDSSLAIRRADILEPWIMIDREIIVNRRAGMFWVMGPSRWTTNEPLPDPDTGQPWVGGFYRNPQNLDRCVGNLLRSAVALRRVVDLY